MIVCVVPAVKFMILPAVVQLRLLNVVEPEIVVVEIVSKITVDDASVNIPLLFQLAPTFICSVPVHLNSPLGDIVTLPFISILFPFRFKIPCVIVKLFSIFIRPLLLTISVGFVLLIVIL